MRLVAALLSLFLLCGGLGLPWGISKSGILTEAPASAIALLPLSDAPLREGAGPGNDTETDLLRSASDAPLASRAAVNIAMRRGAQVFLVGLAPAHPARAPPQHVSPT
jgi:hypothetical protein